MTRNGVSGSWIVLVEHGEAERSRLYRFLNTLPGVAPRRVERVRTDWPGTVLRDPNEAVEFSGYQEGLARVLKKAASDDEPITVVFVNDTLVDGHAGVLARSLLRLLLQLEDVAVGHGALLVGLKMPTHAALHGVAPLGYVSTWAFALRGLPSHLRAVRFYGEDEVLDRFEHAIRPGLPTTYKAWVGDWLQPRKALRGWYKAVPGSPLAEPTRRRKELAIYLEHRLVARLVGCGFHAIDAGELLSPARRRALGLSRWLDRINVNWIKLRHRGFAMLRAHRC